MLLLNQSKIRWEAGITSFNQDCNRFRWFVRQGVAKRYAVPIGLFAGAFTDFIFAVLSEEFGLLGVVVLLLAYGFVVLRGLYLATTAQESYGRLLGGGIVLTFFVYVFVNIGMVSGLMPVVGLPLPLVSYGGTSMVTIMAAFGLLMSVNAHRRLLSE